MLRKISLLFFLPITVLMFVSIAQAQEDNPRHSTPFWQVSFWNNMSLSGTPDLTAYHQSINWDWGYGSPDAAIQSNHYSVRWTRYIQEEPGTYRFTATSDDGIRVYIDNHLIIDEWQDHPATTHVADVPLTAGHHLVVVEYYENAGLATAKVSWSPLQMPEPTQFWRGEYYWNSDLGGMPALVRDDPSINFDWGTGSPSSVIDNDRFSVRWTRSLNFEPGEYRFSTTTDDGVRLWVDGHLLIDQWVQQAEATYSGTIYLSGSTTIIMEYFEQRGVAVARLNYVPVNSPPTPPPVQTVIVDDEGSGFRKGGAARGWRGVNEGHGGHLTWTQNTDRIRANYNWARWYPNLEAGQYEVFVYIPERYSTTNQARYWVSHAGGYTLRTVNQETSSGWVSLGTYQFHSGATSYVSLADVTFEPDLSQLIAFDAVKWVRQ